MKEMTKIRIDVAYHRREKEVLFADFTCFPNTLDSIPDIIISFRDDLMEDDQLELSLTQEQANEFIWALNKMLEIAKMYDDTVPK